MNNNSLKIINIGGTSVQKNMFVYEYLDEIVVFDCGIGFPEIDDFGVDIIIPDFDYLLKNRDKIKGLIITHAHEDHYSAVPYLLKEIPLKIYTHKMVQDFLKNKLKDHNNLQDLNFVSIDSENEFKVGNYFIINPYRVNHSVPNTMGFFVTTPTVTVVHQSDFKFDFTPIMDRPADIHRMVSLSARLKPLLLLSDSLGINAEGFTKSEKFIEETFDSLVSKAQGQVFITTISSNISRIQQAINTGVKHGRKVVIRGYSMENNLEVAIKYGMMKNTKGSLLREEEVRNYKPKNLLYIIPGNYGQVGSSLDKIADNKNKNIKIKPDDLVIFSGDPIPGTEGLVDKLIEKLIKRGAKVVYGEIQNDLHVSGHGSYGDLSLMAHLIMPKYLAPIGGGLKQIKSYKEALSSQGFNKSNIVEFMDGESILVHENFVEKGETIETKQVYVSKDSSSSILTPFVINDRKQISENGVLFVVVPYKNGQLLFNSPNIYTRGFIYLKENMSIINGMVQNVSVVLKSLPQNTDFQTVRRAVEKSLTKHLIKRVGEIPLIVVEKIEIV
ncbi:ribonuclease J [Patescibacteria group bacterium]|nr:ribonuclease J [Patescibacteria group bacterium]